MSLITSEVIIIDVRNNTNSIQTNREVEFELREEDGDEVVVVLEAEESQEGGGEGQGIETESIQQRRDGHESEDELTENEVIEVVEEDEKENDEVDQETEQDKAAISDRRTRKRSRDEEKKELRVIDLTFDTPKKSKRIEQIHQPENKHQEDIIEQLKKQLQCPVCQDDIDEFSSTKCGHIFCWNCARQIVNFLKKCPTCRTKLSSIRDIHRIYF